MGAPLVSIIIPTKNSAATLAATLDSIKNQDLITLNNYSRHSSDIRRLASLIETIVVDNFSTDDTTAIAQRYSVRFFQHGPERSTQRNFGAQQATGEYLLFIDSDMGLSPSVVAELISHCHPEPAEGSLPHPAPSPPAPSVCPVQARNRSASKTCFPAQPCIPTPADLGGDSRIGLSTQTFQSLGLKCFHALIIPEQSVGEDFWARVKALEKSFYQGVPWMEAARFFSREAFEEVGGYDESMVSGEDWDLSQRIAEIHPICRIGASTFSPEDRGEMKEGVNDDTSPCIYHNEGRPSLLSLLKKKYYYAQRFRHYAGKARNSSALKKQANPLARYSLFLSHPLKLFRNPLLGLALLFLKACEFGAGAIGYIRAKYAHNKKRLPE